jgi:hypothetical protein
MSKLVTDDQVREVFEDIQEFGNLTQIRCECCGERRYLSANDCQDIADTINEKIEDKEIYLDDYTIEDHIREYCGE